MSQLPENEVDVLGLFAHDLKNPLGNIQSIAQMIEAAGDLNDMQRKWMLKLYKNIDRVVTLIDSVLDASRFYQMEGINLRPYALSVLVHQALELLDNLINAKGIAVSVTIDPDAEMIYCDNVLFSHALLNLLNNAVKYNAQNGRLAVSAHSGGGYTTIEISDTGVGIPEDALGKVFEKFFRAQTSRGSEGHGLGLSIVKSVIDHHHGSVQVRSTVGEGTTFTVRLPQPPTLSALNYASMAADPLESGEEMDAVDDSTQEALYYPDVESPHDKR